MSAIKTIWKRIESRKVDRYINGLAYEDIQIQKDIVYCLEGYKLDVYRKKGVEWGAVIVNFHGGFFVFGNKAWRSGYAKYMANEGYIVVNVSYVVTGNHMYPNQIRMCADALKWVEENWLEYGFDLERVVLSGDGAGAYFACQLAAANTNPEYARNLDLTGTNFKVRSVVLFRGLYDLHVNYEMNLITGMHDAFARQFLGIQTLSPENMKKVKLLDYISPKRYVTKDFPDTFIAYDVEDRYTVGQAVLLKKILNRYGIPVWEFQSQNELKVRPFKEKNRRKEELLACIKSSVRFLGDSLSRKGIKSDEFIQV